jgi:hypothetical protein
MKKIAFLATAATALALAASGEASSSLVGRWTFDEGSGTTAADSSGYGDNGTLSGGVSWVTGHWGSALAFNGVDGQVDVSDNSALESSTTGVSVSVWVKSTGSPGAYKYILAKGASGCVAASYGLYTGANGGLIFYTSSNSGTSYTLSPDAGTGVWDGSWHNVVGTFDGSTLRLYVDGTQVGSGTPDTTPISYGLPTSNDLLIGNYGGCSGLDFSGSIDQPEIWMKAMSASDVQANMEYEFQGFFQPVDNPPTINATKAGSAIPVKFSLGGNYGLGILASGSPTSGPMTCGGGAPVDPIDQTVTAGSSSLQYDATSNTYTYVWKTDKSWSGTCRQLTVTLSDGEQHYAFFQFK